MFTKIRFNNIDEEIVREKRPVLLACVHPDESYKEQMKTLEVVNEIFSTMLKICVVTPDAIQAVYRAYGVEGTPTFLILNSGREKDRLLGQADSKALTAFIRRIVPSLTMEEGEIP
jgi:thioredoxin-like negative regulator of GroEL